MKRTELVRRTPPRAKAGLKSKSGIARRKAQSAKRVKETGPSKLVVALVFDRDGGCCIRCGKAVQPERRGEDWSIQHRRPRRAGGDRRPETNLPANLVTTCGSATTDCNGWMESHRTAALAAGWLLHANDDPPLVPVQSWWGLLLLDNEGRWRSATQ